MKCSHTYSIYPLILFLVAIVAIGLHASNAMADGEYVVICNASNPTADISKVDLMNIFLGKKVSWDNGEKITFVTLADGEANKSFLRDIVKKNPQQFKNYWKKMLFTGKGVIPQSFPDDAGVIDFVSKNENAVGYISKVSAADGIKVLPVKE